MLSRIRLSVYLLGAISIAMSATSAHAAQPLTAAIDGDRVVVSIDGKEFTSYRFANTLKKPYLWPVIGPKSGKSVTIETPPADKYPHHNSIFFGCDRVNGGNYWQEGIERGQIVSQGPKIVAASGERVIFTDECLWQQPGQDPVIRDTRTITVSAPSETLRFIDFDITLEMLTGITIDKTNHSLFSARMTPELSVEKGGTLVNAEGKKNEEGTFAAASPWCDYSGKWDDSTTEGLAILQHPANRWFPSPWFTRDYGFFSPTPMYWLEGDKLTMPKGEKIELRYRVVVHTGNTEEAGIAKSWEEYQASATSAAKAER